MKKVFQFSGKKIGSMFLVICMVMTLLPTTAFGEDAVQDSGLLRAATGDVVIQESDSITEIKTAIETALTTNSVVTVTGKKTEVDKSLELSIPSGKTVVWKAEFIAETDPGNFLIYFKDTGTLEIANEAVLSTEGAHTIKVENSAILKIKGGSISSKGDIFSAISAVASDVYIEGGAISADGSTANCRAIFAGSGSNLIINGGDISTTGESAVSVYVTGGSQVTVNGGNIDTSGKSATAFSVFNNSTAEVNNGNISSSGNKGKTIDISSGSDGSCTLTVLDGTIQSTGTESIALEIYESNVTIENGTIQADGTTSKAIYVRKNGVLTVEDGNIHADGENGTGIQLWAAKKTEIKAATVTAKGAGGKAVLIENSLAPIKIGNGSLIQATTGYAIEYLQNLTIDGGTIFAYGSDIFGKNNVISQTATTSNGSNISGDNLVILAWNQAAGKTSYTKDSTDDIKTYPSDVTAKWANSGEKRGIAYSHGSNSGFIELPVTVREAGDPITVTSIEVETPPTKTLYSAGDSLDLSGLVATLNKSDSSEEDVAFADFGTKGITTSPVNGTVLTTSDTTVTITYTADNKSTTQVITVNTLAGITTLAELKAALEATTPATINVTANIKLTEATTVGADHTLTIQSGKTLTIGDIPSGQVTLTVPSGKALLVNGEGTLEVSNSATVCGVFVDGSMTVSGGKLTVKNTHSVGILTAGLLSIENGSNISVQNTGEGTTGIQGNVTIKDSSATIANTNTSATECFGISPYSLTIDNSAVSIQSGANSEGIVVRSISNVSILLKNNAYVIADVQGTGIFFSSSSGSLTVDGSTLELQSGEGLDLGFPDEVSFSGINGGTVKLTQGARISNVNGKMKDQGSILTAKSVTVGATDTTPSATGLTAGDYVWDGTYFNKSSGSNSGGGGSSSGGSTGSETTTTPGKTPNQPVTAAVPVTATAGTGGTANAAITEKSVTDAIAKAQTDAKAQGKTANGIAVRVNITMPKGANALTATLTRSSLNSLVSAGITNLGLSGAPVSLSLDLNALKEIQKQSGGDITISIAPANGLSNETKALIGNRPVYNITISAAKDGKTTNVTSLGNGMATLSIPYTPAQNEAIGYLFGVYVDDNGKATRIDGSTYDPKAGAILFPTGHFSVYGIGYIAPSAKFTDISSHWGKEAIDFVVGRGLLSGTTRTTFAPGTAMTRGMLVTALGRLAGVDVKAYTINSFTDVKADSAFCPYIEWAYKKGVVKGIGNQQFAPGRAITREEIAAIFANYAKATGYTLPVTRNAADYADASNIGSAYKIAVTAMQQAGIMMGGSSNKFSPKTNATRAEVSSILHRYIKLTIDPVTAQGWVKNDADGSLAKNTKIDD